MTGMSGILSNQPGILANQAEACSRTLLCHIQSLLWSDLSKRKLLESFFTPPIVQQNLRLIFDPWTQPPRLFWIESGNPKEIQIEVTWGWLPYKVTCGWNPLGVSSCSSSKSSHHSAANLERGEAFVHNCPQTIKFSFVWTSLGFQDSGLIKNLCKSTNAQACQTHWRSDAEGKDNLIFF